MEEYNFFIGVRSAHTSEYYISLLFETTNLVSIFARDNRISRNKKQEAKRIRRKLLIVFDNFAHYY